MYLHIGNDTVVKISEIVAILDAKLLDSSPLLKEFISENDVIHLADYPPAKSIVITNNHIYLSSLGSAALKRKSSKVRV